MSKKVALVALSASVNRGTCLIEAATLASASDAGMPQCWR